MQGHVVANQQYIVENQHEQSHILAALNEKLECVLGKLDHMVENSSNFEQLVQKFTTCFDHSNVLSTQSPASDPIDLPGPTISMPIPAFATA